MPRSLIETQSKLAFPKLLGVMNSFEILKKTKYSLSRNIHIHAKFCEQVRSFIGPLRVLRFTSKIKVLGSGTEKMILKSETEDEHQT